MRADYSAVVAEVPRPSPAQVEDFVSYVFGAHSWYKHLPLFWPGLPFVFYLDPSAGLAQRFERDGTVSFVERREGERFFHYNEMPTRRYLERFGHLMFHAAAGTRVMFVDPVGALQAGGAALATDAPIKVSSTAHGSVEVPPEVLEAGMVRLTGVIHPLTDEVYYWQFWRDRLLEMSWPDESGGRAALERLREVVQRSMQDRESRGATEVESRAFWRARDAEDVREIIAPERERQRREAVSAIGRMLDLVYRPPTR